MTEIKLTVPDKLLLALPQRDSDPAREVRLAAAVKLYELGRLSAGAAAELAGMSKPLFLTKLAEYGVAAFDFSEQELSEDLQNA